MSYPWIDTPIYRVYYRRVVGKCTCETEKNLGEIFDLGEQTAAILFFDEANALFGKRYEVEDAHDRDACSEITGSGISNVALHAVPSTCLNP